MLKVVVGTSRSNKPHVQHKSPHFFAGSSCPVTASGFLWNLWKPVNVFSDARHFVSPSWRSIRHISKSYSSRFYAMSLGQSNLWNFNTLCFSSSTVEPENLSRAQLENNPPCYGWLCCHEYAWHCLSLITFNARIMFLIMRHSWIFLFQEVPSQPGRWVLSAPTTLFAYLWSMDACTQM